MKDFYQHIKLKYDDNTYKLLKQFGKSQRKLAKQQQRLKYLLRCKQYNIIPAHLKGKTDRLQHNFKLDTTRQILQKIEHNFLLKILKLEIKETNLHINSIRSCMGYTKGHLSRTLNDKEQTRFFEAQRQAYTKIREQTGNNLENKLRRRITNNMNNHGFIENKGWFVNQTEVQFPEESKWLLSLGDKFALPTSRDNFAPIQVISEIEQAIQTIEDETLKDATRCSLVNRIKYFKDKIHNNEKEKLILNAYENTRKFLKTQKDIIIMNADKGNKTVVMYREDYNNKMNTLLNDRSTYRTMRKDPTQTLMKKNNSIVNNLYKQNYIDKALKYKLSCSNATAPRIYGLPKIHKSNMPLRPIASSYNIPCYGLSKHLGEILKHIISDELNSTNSYEVKENLKNIIINDDEILISFDVVSLFTNIPVQLALTTIMDKWTTVEHHTKIPKNTFKNLLDFCLKENNYLQYNNVVYNQIYGMPMGNPLSPTIADIVLDKILDDSIKILNNSNIQIKYITKYVDDVLAIVNKKDTEQILRTLNAQHTKIQFTTEIENNKCISYLDLLIHRNNNKKLKFDWYTKSIASGRLINYHSNHSFKQKLNIAKNLITKIYTLSDEDFRANNYQKIQNILANNNFPKYLINQLIKETILKIEHKNKNKNNNNNTAAINKDATNRQYMAVTFIPGLTNNKLLHELIPVNNISYAHKAGVTTKKIYTNTKDKIDKNKQSNVVYEIRCIGNEFESCDQLYVGTTKRSLETRLAEHKADSKKKKTSTALANHLTTRGHYADFDNTKIIDKELKHKTRMTLESLRIQERINKTMNEKEDTDNIGKVYMTVIK